jgi:hypothetical protein
MYRETRKHKSEQFYIFARITLEVRPNMIDTTITSDSTERRNKHNQSNPTIFAQIRFQLRSGLMW